MRSTATRAVGGACAVVLCLVAIGLLSACSSDKPQTPHMLAPRSTPTPDATGVPTPAATLEPTAIPTPTHTPTGTTTPTPSPAEAAAAELSRLIAWFASPLDANHAAAAAALTAIWVGDAGLGGMIARTPWVGDGIAGPEITVLTVLRGIGSVDPVVAQRAAQSLLSPESITERHAQSLERFSQTVVDQDVELARTVSGYDWFADGLTPREWKTIEMLVAPILENPEGVRQIARLAWVADGLTTLEAKVVGNLHHIARYPRLANKVFGYGWVSDDTNYFEQQGLEYIGTIAGSDPAFAITLAQKPWFVDDMTYHEQIAVLYLSYIARRDLALAQEVADSTPGGLKNADLVTALGRLAAEQPQEFGQLHNQLWVADGLNPEERAFTIMLQDAAYISPNLFTDFLESHHPITPVQQP